MILLLAATAGRVSAQNVSVYAGASKTLYDGRFYPDLFGEKVAPVFPTFDVKLGWADNSSSPFASICKHPEVGIGFQLDALAGVKAVNGPGMGNIYSLYGYFDRPFLTVGGFSLGYSGEFGLGFVFSRLYNPDTNPWNVMISSPVNAHISLGLQAQYALSRRFDVGIGLFFNHHSNGAVTFPNYGLNAFELAMRVGMKSPRSVDKQPLEPEDDGFKRRFQFAVQFSGGIMSNEASQLKTLEEKGTWENDRYFKYSFQVNAFYRYARTQASGLGFDLYVTPFCDKIAESDGQGLKYDPVSCGISVLHEMSYRDFSLMVGLGRYLHHNDGLEQAQVLYQMVTLKYYFPKAADMYLGIVLKAHRFRAAESIQFCLGKRF
ncbi:MAG: acyloxyacyl hydrolase [Bacteroidales bacterium]|nr:acyloxyacyl hydrolase [Bacteroidales bacterium]